jgi:hypothetical protein
MEEVKLEKVHLSSLKTNIACQMKWSRITYNRMPVRFWHFM